MDKLSEIERKELCNFLDDRLFLFVSDEHTPTYFISDSPTLPMFTEKEIEELFNNDLNNDYQPQKADINSKQKYWHYNSIAADARSDFC